MFDHKTFDLFKIKSCIELYVLYGLLRLVLFHKERSEFSTLDSQEASRTRLSCTLLLKMPSIEFISNFLNGVVWFCVIYPIRKPSLNSRIREKQWNLFKVNLFWKALLYTIHCSSILYHITKPVLLCCMNITKPFWTCPGHISPQNNNKIFPIKENLFYRGKNCFTNSVKQNWA